LDNEDKTFSKIYDIVLGAQLTALATIGAGMNGHQADRLARTVMEQANYGDAFGHGLGHGVGLETHESPRLGPNSADLLANGMVFTIEPGIYIAGWGGVRIEDTVVMENGKVRSLTRADKKANIC
jgi:Xaa-Pro aminopeptidase